MGRTWPYFQLRSHLADEEVCPARVLTPQGFSRPTLEPNSHRHQVWQTLVVPQRFSMRLLRAVDAGLSAGELARRLHAPPGLSWWDSAPRPRRAAARSAARGLLKAS